MHLTCPTISQTILCSPIWALPLTQSHTVLEISITHLLASLFSQFFALLSFFLRNLANNLLAKVLPDAFKGLNKLEVL